MNSIDVECQSCSGTGLYRGMCEGPGEAVVCLRCDGSGKAVIHYKPFTGRQERDGVKTVRRSQGSLIIGPVGGAGKAITYDEFKRGKMP